MKRKVIISILLIGIVGIAIGVINRPKGQKGEVDDGIPNHFESVSKVIYEIDGKYNSPGGGEMQVYKECYNNCQFDVTITQGAIVVDFYEWPESSTNPKANHIRQERIDESGVYDFSMDYLPEGRYWVELNQENQETIAEVDYKYSNIRK